MRPIVIALAALLLTASLGAVGAVADAEPTTVQLWRTRCAPCHGVSGRGFNQRAQRMAMGDMTTAAWQIEMTDAHIRATIQDGLVRVKLGNRQFMRHFKGKLTAKQIDALVGYIRALARGALPWPGWNVW